jgi:hypothetical protein
MLKVVKILAGLALALMLVTNAYTAEGTKTIKFADGSKIQVPEMAPSFMDKGWSIQFAGTQQFPSGQLNMFMLINKSETVMVVTIDVVCNGKETSDTVGFAVVYINNSNVVEYYEDEAYMKTGKVSGIFTRLPKGTARTGEEYSMWLKNQSI